MYDYLIVGAGFAGSTAAERLASLGKRILLIDKRAHIGGNAYDEFDENGILIHKYGPHIFHTNDKDVFEYLSQFTEWNSYEHKVMACHKSKLYNIPVNRKTLNSFFNQNLTSEEEVEKLLENIRISRPHILNSEDYILNKLGEALYNAFFRNYTFKQWGKYPNELDASVCGRIPVRYNDYEGYFSDKYQCMPKYGYTKMFEKMLGNKNIVFKKNTDYKDVINTEKFDKIIFTGPIDSFFDYQFGKLEYRSLDFEFKNYDCEFFQKAPVINYVDEDIPYTRISEYKWITGQQSKTTTVSYEYPREVGEPYYPVPTPEQQEIYRKYKKEAEKIRNLHFIGRLGKFQYYNMDQVIAEVLFLIKSGKIK